MQIQAEEKEYCKVVVQYRADASEVVSKRDEIVFDVVSEVNGVVKDAAEKSTTAKKNKKITVAGYRPGKAPIHVIKHKYKKLIEDRTKSELLAKAQEDIAFETKMKTIFYPQILHCTLNDTHFECSLLFFKKPELELKEYKGLEVPKPHAPKTVTELTGQMLQELRVNYGDVAPYQEGDFVQTGDKITMDVHCRTADAVDHIPELTKEGEFYSVGSNSYFKDFDDNLLGMTAGETREFDLLNDQEERLTFKVTVHMGVKATPAALDDAFAQRLNVADFETLHDQVASAAAQQITNYEKSALHDQITKRLVSDNNFEVPDFLVDMDCEQLAAQYKLKLSELDDNTRSILVEKSKERVRLSLIFETIRENEPDCQHSMNEMVEVIKARLAAQGQDPEKGLVEAQKSGRLFGMVAALQQEAMLEWLVSQSKITE